MKHKIIAPSPDFAGDPAPTYPTEAAIRLAERLRHQLEEQYIGRSADSSPTTTKSGDMH